MIRKISRNSVNSQNVSFTNNKNDNRNQSFKGIENIGGAVLGATTAGLAYCESIPMLNVAVLDLSTAILPRTYVESQTNPYAGLEAFRRESSGLIINCIIPGFIVMGIAKAIQPLIMGKNSQMAKCWANADTVNLISKTWETASDVAKDSSGKELFRGDKQKAKVYNTIRTILENTVGADGKKVDVSLKGINFDNSIKTITLSVFKKNYSKRIRNAVSGEIGRITDKTHISDNIKIALTEENKKALAKGKPMEYFSQSLSSVLENSPHVLRELVNAPKDKPISEIVSKFTGKASSLVKYKSLLGLGVIIPLALSAQPINRWITEKASGKKGAPIYKDFDKTKSKELTPQEKAALTRQKFISIGSMVGVALVSIMKKPDMKMVKEIFQFKSKFPNMDQARIISTATFASRMASSQDRNDLREATTRDIATFLSFYFIGDYVSKGIATILEKTPMLKNKGIVLVNDKKPLKGTENILQKFWHWTKNTALKSSSEVYADLKNGGTAEEIEKSNKFAKNMRGVCQLGNILFSMVALGFVIPHFYRKKTEKNHEAEMNAAKSNQVSQNITKPEKTKSTGV